MEAGCYLEKKEGRNLFISHFHFPSCLPIPTSPTTQHHATSPHTAPQHTTTQQAHYTHHLDDHQSPDPFLYPIFGFLYMVLSCSCDLTIHFFFYIFSGKFFNCYIFRSDLIIYDTFLSTVNSIAKKYLIEI